MIISFANQKGGSQKTTMTQIFASIVHANYPEIKLAVIDADLQASYFIQRYNELNEINDDDSGILNLKLDKLNEQTGKEIYPVHKCNLSSGEVITKIDELQNNGFNLILVDFPGSLESPGYVEVLKKLDYIFIPFSADQKTTSSSLSFLGALIKLLKDPELKFKVKDYAIVFSKYTKNEKLREYHRFVQYRDLFLSKKINILENGFMRSQKFESEQVSTIFPFPNSKENENISPYPLVGELLEFMFTKR